MQFVCHVLHQEYQYIWGFFVPSIENDPVYYPEYASDMDIII